MMNKRKFKEYEQERPEKKQKINNVNDEEQATAETELKLIADAQQAEEEGQCEEEEREKDNEFLHKEITAFKSRFQSIFRCGNHPVPLQHIWIHYNASTLSTSGAFGFVSLTGPMRGGEVHHHWSCECGQCQRNRRSMCQCRDKQCRMYSQKSKGRWATVIGEYYHSSSRETAYNISPDFPDWVVVTIDEIDACWLRNGNYTPALLHEEARPILEEMQFSRNLIGIINEYANKPALPIGHLVWSMDDRRYHFACGPGKPNSLTDRIVDFDSPVKSIEDVDGWASTHWDYGYNDQFVSVD